MVNKKRRAGVESVGFGRNEEIVGGKKRTGVNDDDKTRQHGRKERKGKERKGKGREGKEKGVSVGVGRERRLDCLAQLKEVAYHTSGSNSSLFCFRAARL